MYLLDVNRLRDFSVKDDCYLQRISVRFCLSDRETILDDTHVEIPVEDHKQIHVTLKEPISPETLSVALIDLGNAIIKFKRTSAHA